jgi:hypothetical protein
MDYIYHAFEILQQKVLLKKGPRPFDLAEGRERVEQVQGGQGLRCDFMRMRS